MGIAATLKATEPAGADKVLHGGRGAAVDGRGFFDAVVGPFVAFFKTWGGLGLLMLVFISLYRLPEFVMGPMATPFYHDLGISKDTVGPCGPRWAWPAPSSASRSAGFCGPRRAHAGLIFGGLLQGSPSRASRSSPSTAGIRAVRRVMTFDNFGVSVAGVALVTYMSSLTSLGYTATQYALLSSAYAIVGKFLKGFSGAVVDGLQAQGHTLMDSYAIFFVGRARSACRRSCSASGWRRCQPGRAKPSGSRHVVDLKCRPRPFLEGRTTMGLYRSRSEKIIAGVCGGIAEWLGWSPTAVRIGYVIISIASVVFPGTLAYIVLWTPHAQGAGAVGRRGTTGRAALPLSPRFLGGRRTTGAVRLSSLPPSRPPNRGSRSSSLEESDEPALSPGFLRHGPFLQNQGTYGAQYEDAPNRSSSHLASEFSLWQHLLLGGLHVLQHLIQNFLRSPTGRI